MGGILRAIRRDGATFGAAARSRSLMLRSLIGLLLLTVVVLPSPARASGWDVIEDCRDEVLTKTYTQAEYDEALDTFPSDGREYSGCYEIILDAKRAAAREAAKPPAKERERTGDRRTPGRGPGTTEGAVPTDAAGAGGPAAPSTPPAAGGSVDLPYVAPTPQDAAALSAAARDGERRLRIGGAALVPEPPAVTTRGLARYPAPVLALLGLLGGGLLLGVLALLRGGRLSAR